MKQKIDNKYSFKLFLTEQELVKFQVVFFFLPEDCEELSA